MENNKTSSKRPTVPFPRGGNQWYRSEDRPVAVILGSPEVVESTS